LGKKQEQHGKINSLYNRRRQCMTRRRVQDIEARTPTRIQYNYI